MKCSGSDIAVEADLSDLIGNVRLDRDVVSGFFEVLSKEVNVSANIISRALDIKLRNGPGPTVQRASRQPGPHQSMLVQCMT